MHREQRTWVHTTEDFLVPKTLNFTINQPLTMTVLCYLIEKQQNIIDNCLYRSAHAGLSLPTIFSREAAILTGYRLELPDHCTVIPQVVHSSHFFFQPPSRCIYVALVYTTINIGPSLSCTESHSLFEESPQMRLEMGLKPRV